ncbi:NADH dehydrogenase FAD-containing subunit [Catenuloplanes nepalensis]|uniref:NADH dehydrogenase FAD-containing subunit n=1 Tax=Catenuloplanes nepalensis TaxID=587533 RepID=A0ABT9MST9_9ACTN|nr:FAD-dependent oxidoreductase [Catenuloplanes nepalensis]MDP9794091.1 NADH dehydrogenase FAD-containing subunit [Catenuloplanes nepalensis]
MPGTAERVRVVVAGLGDTGLIAAIKLARHHRLLDLVGITTKAAWLSGRDVGLQLARPERWADQYNIAFSRFPAMDRVRQVHGTVTGLDEGAREVTVQTADGATTREPYDVLLIATGVRNGVWRSPDLQDQAGIDETLHARHAQVASAESIAVVGGGPAAMSYAAQLAETFPGKPVSVYFPGDRGLTRHHPRVWDTVRPQLERLGVHLHPHHRAETPPDLAPSPGPVRFTTGQPPAEAALVLWATGRVRPNTEWLPSGLLDADGFVRVGPDLSVPGHDGIWAVGDVAATDPLRATARNFGAQLVARNILRSVRGRSTRAWRPPSHAQGTVLGPLHDGLQVFHESGSYFRYSVRVYDAVERHIVSRLYYSKTRPK